MLVKKKFKRLKINAGFTLSIANGVLAVKLSETHYRILGTSDKPTEANKTEEVWVDSLMLKPWWKW